MVIDVPGAPIVPGASVPPLLTLTLVNVPVPASVPLLLIVTGDVIEPLTASVPASTKVGPV